MTALQQFAADAEPAELMAALARDGACIALDLLDPGHCAQLRDDFQPHLDLMHWGVDELGYRDSFYGSSTKRLHGLFSKSPGMLDVLTHPRLLSVARALLVDSGVARDLRLSNTELMVLDQHQQEQELHRDAASWHRAQAWEQAAGQEVLVSANVALTPFTANNGATRVVPGSHLWPKDRVPAPDEISQAVMPQGAALLYSGNVIHSGGANLDASQRVGLYLGYVVSWLRPIENQLVTNLPEDILALPAAARQLLDVVPGGFTVMA